MLDFRDCLVCFRRRAEGRKIVVSESAAVKLIILSSPPIKLIGETV